MDFKSTQTVRHTINTASYAATIGELMGCSNNQINKLYTAALLHDLGKMAIPESILESPTILSNVEFILMKTHVGYTIKLLQNSVPEDIFKIAAHHHEKLDELSKEEIKETIIKTNELIYSVIKKTPKLLRPPYGIVNDTLKEVCGELNMTIILWTADKDSKDWALTKDSEIINNLTKKVSNGDIFLFHDGNKKFTNTLSAIDVIIPTLKKKGYKWVTISKLINN